MRQPTVVIVGAGMTGIVCFIKLKAAGIQNIIILEKKDKVGGTWRENTYPGVACDVPAHLYSYSFELSPNFSHQYARGHELLNYFQTVSDKYGVTEHVRFNEEVLEAKYIAGQWHIKTNNDDSLIADFLISATGILHHPNKPHINGLEDFKGTHFHTAEWNHDIDLRDKKIAFIGTGSTACQAIPALIQKGYDVNIFQRTPQWLFPLPDVEYSDKFKQRSQKHPWLMKALRKIQHVAIEQLFTKATAGHKAQYWLMDTISRRYLKNSIKDPELRKKLTPDYKVGCKRVVVSTSFYDAIQQDNATLTTEGIDKIVAEGIVTKDGMLHEADVIVFSTGFDAFKFMRPMNLIGTNGLDINTAWERKVQAYQSVLLPHFPNFFLMLGPNSPIGNFSVTRMSEVQADYLVKLISLWQQEKISAIEISEGATEQFNTYVKEGFGNTAWATGGCKSWYLDADGDPIVWPYTWKEWETRMQNPVMSDFVMTP